MKSYPLQWPSGWKREPRRKGGMFSSKSQVAQPGGWRQSRAISIATATQRVLAQLSRFGVAEGDAIISTNLKLRLDGLPKGDQSEPLDPGVAVYWQRAKDTQHKVMAIDRYNRVADNLAAIAATLEAMRAIERHGGAVILERAFTGFLALPAPNTWRAVLGYEESDMPPLKDVKVSYLDLCNTRHPDRNSSPKAHSWMVELNWAWAEAQKELQA